MNMEHWWNYTNRNRLTYQEKPLYHCRIVHRKTRMYRPGIESGRPQWIMPHSQKSIQKRQSLGSGKLNLFTITWKVLWRERYL